MFDPAILGPAIPEAFRKLDPRHLVRNPVMFAVAVVATLVGILFIRDIFSHAGNLLFTGQILVWLWVTVLFATFAEAVAEGRGKAQAAFLRRARTETTAKRLTDPRGRRFHEVGALELQVNDVVLVEAGDTIPGDGEVVEGIASVNESAITGESAPVIRESGGDRSAVTGGTLVLSDWIKVRVTAGRGSSFLDRMIALAGAKRRAECPEIGHTQRLGLRFPDGIVRQRTLRPASSSRTRGCTRRRSWGPQSGNERRYPPAAV